MLVLVRLLCMLPVSETSAVTFTMVKKGGAEVEEERHGRRAGSSSPSVAATGPGEAWRMYVCICVYTYANSVGVACFRMLSGPTGAGGRDAANGRRDPNNPEKKSGSPGMLSYMYTSCVLVYDERSDILIILLSISCGTEIKSFIRGLRIHRYTGSLGFLKINHATGPLRRWNCPPPPARTVGASELGLEYPRCPAYSARRPRVRCFAETFMRARGAIFRRVPIYWRV